ncbi:hypothetical protein BKA62DRAFT_492198 [Auriculariales sp. MPI-PUGE-AT-0066]|nr:hypothetical protein BKA62DRAFT_492198 [Auriculariales sp. MPI-PUGE-AT-0066]
MTEQQMKPGMASAEKQIHALDEVAQYLPPFRATWTIHDGPGAFASWEMKDAARKAAAAGTYVDGSRIKTDAEGFAAACPPHSPIRHANYSVPVHFDVAEYQHVFPKSFIADLHASLDICSAPDLIPLSPLGSRPGPGPSPDRTLFARFARSKTLLHPDILGVPLVEMNESQDDIPWANKTDQRMLWRGRTTGGRWAKAPWDIQRSSARLRFVALTGLKNGTVPVLLPPHNDTSDFEVRDIELSELNQLFDVGIIDTVQCDPEICERIKQTHNVKEPIFPDKGKHYKYIFDVDGNAWSSRFRRLMTRNSLLFKSTVFPEWWTDRVMPWVHFVPVKVDYSDLYDALVFFRGLPDGSVAGQDQLGERIAMAGRDWVERFWRHEDITAYTWRMYMEFARVTSTNRTSLDFIMPDQAHP